MCTQIYTRKQENKYNYLLVLRFFLISLVVCYVELEAMVTLNFKWPCMCRSLTFHQAYIVVI